MAVDTARAKSLFLAASDLADAEERAAYLDRECGGDAALRDRVEALLRANDAAPPAQGRVGSATGSADPDVTSHPPTRAAGVLPESATTGAPIQSASHMVVMPW